MRVIAITQPGGSEVLQHIEIDDPTPAAGEVVIDIVAAGMNRADVLQRQGHYAPPPGATKIPGLECSGTISAVGDGVNNWEIGTEVCALLPGGGYASKVAVPAGHVLPIPDGVSLAEAAALPEAAATVWLNLFDTARLTPGDTVLIHGGSGGIGTLAIQVAAFFGARVFCTASPAKADACRALGAERVIDYHTEDFTQVIHTEADGADVILDTIGAKYLEHNVTALAPFGRCVVIGLQGGRVGQLDLNRLLTNQATIAGTLLRPRSAQYKAAILDDVRTHLWPVFAAGRLRPVIDRAFAMADASQAHEYFESGTHTGKVLLVN